MSHRTNLQKGTVLAIDDDIGVLDVIKMALEREGYAVHVASGANEGIQLYQKHWSSIWLVVLDFTLPKMKGDVVLERLQRINPEVRVLLMTGTYGLGENEEFESGLAGYLQKPFPMAELVKRVHTEINLEILERNKAERLARQAL